MTDLSLPGLKKTKPLVHMDARGFFLECYSEKIASLLGLEGRFVQQNLSSSCYKTLRGLHFQSTPGQAKLVSCLQGTIWDVAVDLREGSPTFLQWQSVILDAKEFDQLFIPVGFAHGFCVLSPNALVHYQVSSFYDPQTECAIRWNDPQLGIEWPFPDPLLSERDQTSPFYQEVFL